MRMPYKIPKSKREKILREAIKVASQVRVDQLDCSVSCARQPTDKTVEEVLKLGLNDAHTLYSFILRAGQGMYEDYYDVGLSTIGVRPEYFLWIELSIDNGLALIKKFKLKERQ